MNTNHDEVGRDPATDFDWIQREIQAVNADLGRLRMQVDRARAARLRQLARSRPRVVER